MCGAAFLRVTFKKHSKSPHFGVRIEKRPIVTYTVSARGRNAWSAVQHLVRVTVSADDCPLRCSHVSCNRSWGMRNHVMIISSPLAPSPREQFSCSSYYLVTLLLLHYCYIVVALCVGHMGTQRRIPLIEGTTVMGEGKAASRRGMLV